MMTACCTWSLQNQVVVLVLARTARTKSLSIQRIVGRFALHAFSGIGGLEAKFHQDQDGVVDPWCIGLWLNQGSRTGAFPAKDGAMSCSSRAMVSAVFLPTRAGW